MKRWFRRIAHAMLFAGALALGAAPAAAQSILRDAETEQLFADMMRPIIVAAGLSPNNVRVVLLNDKEVNAFVAGGQTVYVNSALLDAATSANEVQGVVAHEIGHIVGGHVPLQDQGVKPAIGISLLSLALGLAAMAAGSGEAGAAILSAGQTAAMGKFLAFSRSQEASADAAAVRFLNAANVSGKGFVSFFKKMQDMEYRLGYKTADIDPFAQSHPMFADRISTATDSLQKSASWNKPFDPDLERRFKRVQAKLRGYLDEPKATLVRYPASDQSIYAHYARAYAYHQGGYPEQAAEETTALIKLDPQDPYFLELQGQIMLEAGDPKGALGPLRQATQLTNYSPLIATTFGHALIATEDRSNLAEAEKVLRQAVVRDDDNPFAWFQLGMAYTQEGDNARAALAMAEQASLTGDLRTAAQSARTAVAGLKPGTPDYIRAQDIQVIADNELAQMKKVAQPMNAQVSMRPLFFAGSMVIAAALGAGLALLAQTALPVDRARTGQLIRTYLLDHPELLRETAERLRLKESGKLIADNHQAIVDPYAGAQAGNPKGDVTLVEYLDYACGYCRASLPEIDKLLAKDANVRIVYREYPVLSEESRVAARWALAAAEQGKYRAFHDALYALDGPTDANIQSAARSAGLDLAKAQAAAASPRVVAEIEKNLAVGNKLGVSGTPGWVIGDRVVVGAIPYEQLAGTVAEARKSKS